MFFVNYLPEFLYEPLKLSNVRLTDFANSKHALGTTDNFILPKKDISNQEQKMWTASLKPPYSN